MAKKSLGYVELEWECSSCGNRNPGGTKTCAQCGAAHGEGEEFVQAAQETILTDEAKIAVAEAGPDIHCGYCGTRNPATRTACKQCGADLTEGRARAADRVVGAFRSQPAPSITCPSCGAANPGTARQCQQCGESLVPAEPPAQPTAQPAAPKPGGCGRLLPLILVGIVAVIALFIFLSSRTSELVGEVSGVNWRRAIAVEAFVPVTREAWRDEIPAGVEIGRCRQEVHHVQDEPEAGAKEVCGTPYVVDKGSGYGEVVQDCRYQVYADRCEYQTVVWQSVAPLVLEGTDLNPRWPAANLGTDQRAGGSSETYTVVFDTDGNRYTYTPRDAAEFSQYGIGSRWLLKVNALGTITNVSPR